MEWDQHKYLIVKWTTRFDSRRVRPRLINTGPLFPVEMFRALPLIDFPRNCRLCVAPANVNQYGDLLAGDADC